MKDLVILSVILVFWVSLGSILTYIYQDPLIVADLVAGNSSYVINIDSSIYAGNLSETDSEIVIIGTTASKTKGFLNMIGRMFTFRIPAAESIPSGITSIIEWVNFGLLLIVGLIVYRLIRHGGG